MNKVFALFDRAFLATRGREVNDPTYTFYLNYLGYEGPEFESINAWQIRWSSPYNHMIGMVQRPSGKIVQWTAWSQIPYDMGPTYE